MRISDWSSDVCSSDLSKRAMLFLRRRMLEIGLDLTLQLQRQRVALTVACVSRSHPYPPFADAIFLHIGLFHALEATAYVPLQKRRVMRSEERRVGNEGVRTIRVRGWAHPTKTKKKKK